MTMVLPQMQIFLGESSQSVENRRPWNFLSSRYYQSGQQSHWKKGSLVHRELDAFSVSQQSLKEEHKYQRSLTVVMKQLIKLGNSEFWDKSFQTPNDFSVRSTLTSLGINLNLKKSICINQNERFRSLKERKMSKYHLSNLIHAWLRLVL